MTQNMTLPCGLQTMRVGGGAVNQDRHLAAKSAHTDIQCCIRQNRDRGCIEPAVDCQYVHSSSCVLLSKTFGFYAGASCRVLSVRTLRIDDLRMENTPRADEHTSMYIPLSLQEEYARLLSRSGPHASFLNLTGVLARPPSSS